MSKENEQARATEQKAYVVAVSVAEYLFKRCERKDLPSGTTMAMVIGVLQAVAFLNSADWVSGLRAARPEWDQYSDKDLTEGLNAHMDRVRKTAFESVVAAQAAAVGDVKTVH